MKMCHCYWTHATCEIGARLRRELDEAMRPLLECAAGEDLTPEEIARYELAATSWSQHEKTGE